MAESKLSSRRVAAQLKAAQAVELRIGGATLEQIATALDYKGASSARYAIENALRRTMQKPSDLWREVQLRRLQRLLVVLWPMATDPAQPNFLMAHREARETVNDISKLLGVDIAPQKTLEEAVAEVAAEMKATPEELTILNDEMDRYLKQERKGNARGL